MQVWRYRAILTYLICAMFSSFPVHTYIGSIMRLILAMILGTVSQEHDGVIKWKHFPRYWSFVRGIHRSPADSPHKDQWRGALMFSLICVWTNGWANNRGAGDLRHHRGCYDVTVINFAVKSKHYGETGILHSRVHFIYVITMIIPYALIEIMYGFRIYSVFVVTFGS